MPFRDHVWSMDITEAMYTVYTNVYSMDIRYITKVDDVPVDRSNVYSIHKCESTTLTT